MENNDFIFAEFGNTLPELIRKSAERFGDRLLFKFDESDELKYTYSEFLSCAEECALKLKAMGLKKGFKAIICMETRPEWYIFFWGVQLAGGIVINYSHKSAENNLLSVIRDTRVSVLLTTKELKKDTLSEFSDFLNVITCDENAETGMTWESFMNINVPDDVIAAPEEKSDINDTCLIQYTSGSSGEPKGVMLSHRGIIYVTYHCADNTGMDSDDKVMAVSPLSHSLGLINCMLCPMIKGSSIYPLSEFTPGHSVKCIERNGITMTVSVPSVFMKIFEYAESKGNDVSTFKKGAVGGAQLTPDMIKYLVCDKGMKDLVHGYGMTEFTSEMMASDHTDDVEVKMHTIGHVVPGSEAKIIDIMTGEEITEPDKEGELYFKGAGRMNGYFGIDSSDISSPDKFYATGDIVKRRPDGNYVITGKRSDIVIKGGENISPAEVQKVLLSCEGVESAVVGGVSDEALGEELVAFIIAENIDINNLKKELSGKTEENKIPRYIVVVKDFLYNANGKPDKKRMIADFEKSRKEN